MSELCISCNSSVSGRRHAVTCDVVESNTAFAGQVFNLFYFFIYSSFKERFSVILFGGKRTYYLFIQVLRR